MQEHKQCTYLSISIVRYRDRYQTISEKLWSDSKRPRHDFNILDISFPIQCVLVESLRYCCLSAFSPSLMVTFSIQCFSISQAWNTHAHKCICTHIRVGHPDAFAHVPIHTNTHNEKEVLMSNYCHYGTVTWWNKLDLHGFNILDGKWNK